MLADKVTPSKIVDRQKRKVTGAFHSSAEKTTGTNDPYDEHRGAVGVTGDATADANDATVDAGRRAVVTATGNPVVVGLIAFGVDLLAASLIQAIGEEKQLAAQAKDAALPALNAATEVGKQVADDVKEPAR